MATKTDPQIVETLQGPTSRQARAAIREQLPPLPDVLQPLRENAVVDVWPTAARALSIGRHTAYEMCRSGRIRIIVCGRRWRVVSKDLLRMLGEE